MIQFITSTPWIQQVGLVLGGALLGFLIERVFRGTLRAIAKRTSMVWDDLVVDAFHGMPLLWGISAGLWGAARLQGLSPDLQYIADSTLMVVIVASLTLVGMRAASGAVRQYAAKSPRLPSTTLVSNLVKMLIGTIGLFLILQNLNIEIGPLLTALGIGGLAVALALQDTLSNLFAGISIILSGQVRPHDYLELASGEQGFVTDVKARNTTIRTFPNHNLVVVPNGVLASSIVTNYSLPKRNLVIAVPVGVSYDSDLEEVERIVLDVASQVLEAVEGGSPETPPTVRYQDFGDSSINFNVLLAAGRFTDQFLIRHQFIKKLHARFNEEGIEIPFPIRTIHMRGPEGAGDEA